MKKNSTKLFLIITASIFICTIWIIRLVVLGQVNIGGTVRISVCGDGVAEGPEQCDNTDLQGLTCSDLGYSGGVLTCDVSCQFEVIDCIIPSPTPSFFPTIIPTPTPTEQFSIISPTPSTVDLFSPTLNTQQVSLQQESFFDSGSIIRSSLPEAIRAFDLRGIDRLLSIDLYEIVRLWLEAWQADLRYNELRDENPIGVRVEGKCDLNDDGICDIQDFSILMYYIER